MADVVDTPIGSRLAEGTVCLSIRRAKFGNRRQASTNAITVDSDKTLLGLRKTILVSPELAAVASLDGETDAYLSRKCLPTWFARHLPMLPIALVEEVDAELRRFQARRAILAAAAIDTFPVRWRETQERLGVLTGAMTPPVDAFGRSFKMEWQFIVWDTPASLRTINAQLFEAERRKAADRLERVAHDCETAMFAGLQGLLTKVVTALTPQADGKLRRFHPSVVVHLTEFLQTCPFKNVTGNEALADLARQTEAALAGLDPATIKEVDAAGRLAIAASFAAIESQLVPLVGGRHIAFDEDEDAA
jgi:hypothetical protein